MLSIVIGSIVGLVVAIPLTIVPTSKFLSPRAQLTFFSISLIPIALFYIGFCWYFEEPQALKAEVIGVIGFSVLALWSYFSATWILIWAYLLHAVWDLVHELPLGALESINWSSVPPGYAAFCLVYDVIIAIYVFRRLDAWNQARSA
jgi:hypothetical protein